MDARLEGLCLEDVTGHGGRRDAQVGHVDTGRREAGDERPLDHAARVRRGAARDDAVAAPERRTESGGEPDRGLPAGGRRSRGP